MSAAESTLVIDTSPVARLGVVRALESLHVDNIVECGSAEAALEVAHKGRLRCAVTAMVLPGVNGFELAGRLRETAGNERMMILGASAQARATIDTHAGTPLDGYFDKRDGLDQLVVFLRSHLLDNGTISGRVLVVVESELAARFMVRILGKQGAVVDHAKTGDDAIHDLTGEITHGRWPAVALICDLATRNAIDVIKHVRTELGLNSAQLPIIGLVDDETNERRVALLCAGVNEVFEKPISAARLLPALRYLTQRARLAQVDGPPQIISSGENKWRESPKQLAGKPSV